MINLTKDFFKEIKKQNYTSNMKVFCKNIHLGSSENNNTQTIIFFHSIAFVKTNKKDNFLMMKNMLLKGIVDYVIQYICKKNEKYLKLHEYESKIQKTISLSPQTPLNNENNYIKYDFPISFKSLFIEKILVEPVLLKNNKFVKRNYDFETFFAKDCFNEKKINFAYYKVIVSFSLDTKEEQFIFKK